MKDNQYKQLRKVYLLHVRKTTYFMWYLSGILKQNVYNQMKATHCNRESKGENKKNM